MCLNLQKFGAKEIYPDLLYPILASAPVQSCQEEESDCHHEAFGFCVLMSSCLY
jgi:hypothetical protein